MFFSQLGSIFYKLTKKDRTQMGTVLICKCSLPGAIMMRSISAWVRSELSAGTCRPGLFGQQLFQRDDVVFPHVLQRSANDQHPDPRPFVAQDTRFQAQHPALSSSPRSAVGHVFFPAFQKLHLLTK